MSGLNLIKLCVGAESVEDHKAWIAHRMEQRRASGEDPRPRHTTRMRPKRADELLDGGSLYWVTKGYVTHRQLIENLQETTGDDGIRRCNIILKPEVILVQTRFKRPFQGWRYLTAEDAPPDLKNQGRKAINLPPHLATELDSIGVVAV
ncbi:MAG: DUF1489 domain-containing protein [Pseudomonadota bacterium]